MTPQHLQKYIPNRGLQSLTEPLAVLFVEKVAAISECVALVYLCDALTEAFIDEHLVRNNIQIILCLIRLTEKSKIHVKYFTVTKASKENFLMAKCRAL